jgi:hypothetical protein
MFPTRLRAEGEAGETLLLPSTSMTALLTFARLCWQKEQAGGSAVAPNQLLPDLYLRLIQHSLVRQTHPSWHHQGKGRVRVCVCACLRRCKQQRWCRPVGSPLVACARGCVSELHTPTRTHACALLVRTCAGMSNRLCLPVGTQLFALHVGVQNE